MNMKKFLKELSDKKQKFNKILKGEVSDFGFSVELGRFSRYYSATYKCNSKDGEILKDTLKKEILQKLTERQRESLSLFRMKLHEYYHIPMLFGMSKVNEIDCIELVA